MNAVSLVPAVCQIRARLSTFMEVREHGESLKFALPSNKLEIFPHFAVEYPATSGITNCGKFLTARKFLDLPWNFIVICSERTQLRW